MGAIINEKIIEFAVENDLNVVGQYGRNRIAREVKYYTISSSTGVSLGAIKPDCSYEQFLEKIAMKAISEAERLYDLTDVMEAEYNELCEDYEALKEEVTDGREDN